MEVSSELVRELLHYDPATGAFTWRERGSHWFEREEDRALFNSRWAGRSAGSAREDVCGYQNVQIKICGKSRQAHRLAWLYMSDDPLPEQIDHRDRDATNNRWHNLRASNYAKNMRNKSTYRTNTSGITGVSWDKESRKWRAFINANGKRSYLGRFANIADAVTARQAALVELGFDAGHGAYLPHYA